MQHLEGITTPVLYIGRMVNAKLNEFNTKLKAENKAISNKTSTMSSKEN